MIRIGHLLRHLSIADWLPSYDRAALRGDVSAGLAVGVMLVPQAMAYALIAGVPPVYGLYASLVPLLVYPIFGSARRLAAGIVALDMLVVGAGLQRMQPASPEEAAALAVTLTAVVGVIHIVFGALRLGFVAEWLSRPVISGFMFAAPLLIALSQVDALVGLSVSADHPARLLAALGEALPSLHLGATAIGVTALAALLAIRRWAPRWPRALLIVAASTAAVWALGLGSRGVPVVGAFEPGLPSLRWPIISVDHVRGLAATGLTLALLQLMVAVTLGRKLADRGDDVRPNRELGALGAANLVGSFFGSVPVSASLSRTAVNADAGAQTPLANVVAAAVVALGLVALPRVFDFVPSAALAAIIIAAALSMIDLRALRQLFEVRRSEGWLAMVTLFTTLGVGIQEGLLFGVAASMLFLLYQLSRPHVATLGEMPSGAFRDRAVYPHAREHDEILVLRVDAPVTFANADWLRRTLTDRVRGTEPQPRFLVIDGRGINLVDVTGTDALAELAEALDALGVELHLANLKSSVRETIARGRSLERLTRHAALDITLDAAIQAIESRPSR